MKNRHHGSHELNKDSSRSHSILTVYLISEIKNMSDGHVFKKYGKVSFVDLAGSERLKESKSEGTMVKETGNINKSLFTLGKVISMLAAPEKMAKKDKQYIPYRDSKLTMLLMDSLGGTSKALMIACISPSSVYIEETLSTLNYACRTMNIKNKPVIQMDPKEQIIFNQRREIQLLKLENAYLKDTLSQNNGGGQVVIPSAEELSKYKGKIQPITGMAMSPQQQTMRPMIMSGHPDGKLLDEFQIEVERMRQENAQLRMIKELKERDYEGIIFEN